MHGFPFFVLAAAWFVIFTFGGRKAPDMPECTDNPNTQHRIICVADEDISAAPMVLINGHLYYDTGEVSDSPVFSGPDGHVENSVLSGQVPGTEGESNFGTGYGYRYGINDTVEVEIDGIRHIFKPD